MTSFKLLPRNPRVTCSVALAAALLVTAPVHANLLSNGSFENTGGTFVGNSQGYMTLFSGSTALPGWTVTANNLAWISNVNPFGNTSSQGDFNLDLTGVSDNGTFAALETSFSTTIGADYSVSFDLGANNGPCNGLDCTGPMGVRVDVTGSASRDFTGFDPAGPGQQWASYGFDFTATASTTTLRIAGLSAGRYYLGLDNVAVVPEPATWLLLAGGLLAVGAARRRGG